jgi:hypothetical protein
VLLGSGVQLQRHRSGHPSAGSIVVRSNAIRRTEMSLSCLLKSVVSFRDH